MARDRRGGARQVPKTYSRWLRCTLLANGVNLPIHREDAGAVAEFLVATGRAVPPASWVDHFVNLSADAALEVLF